MILQQLKSAGADMSQEREVIHYLYMPTREASHAAAEALRSKGYSVEEKMSATAKPDTPNPFLVLATKHMVLTPWVTHEFGQLFEELASFHQGDYDGWEAAANP